MLLYKCKQFYDERLREHFGSPLGCSDREIMELEELMGRPIPVAYREYLAWMGADHRGAFRGSDWFAKDVAENTDYVPELLGDNDVSWELPDAFLSFFCHQGYMCAWFDLEEATDDPQCWFFREGGKQHPDAVGTFSEFLLRELEQIHSMMSPGK